MRVDHGSENNDVCSRHQQCEWTMVVRTMMCALGINSAVDHGSENNDVCSRHQ